MPQDDDDDHHHRYLGFSAPATRSPNTPTREQKKHIHIPPSVHGTTTHGMARHGKAWNGMAWHGMSWYGIANPPSSSPSRACCTGCRGRSRSPLGHGRSPRASVPRQRTRSPRMRSPTAGSVASPRSPQPRRAQRSTTPVFILLETRRVGSNGRSTCVQSMRKGAQTNLTLLILPERNKKPNRYITTGLKYGSKKTPTTMGLGGERGMQKAGTASSSGNQKASGERVWARRMRVAFRSWKRT